MNRFTAWYYAQPVALRTILAINVVIYVLWLVILSHIGVASDFFWQYLVLNPELPGIFWKPWELITYNFLHLGVGQWSILHILFNMLWLVWIGREFEEMHGAHRMWSAYIISGIGGGLVSVLLNIIVPGTFFGGYIYGASASVLGIMMVVATLYPYRSVGLMFIGNVRLVHVVYGFLVFDLLFISSSQTAVGAHLGGALFGYLFARAEGRGMDLSSWAKIFTGRKTGGYRQSREGVFNQMESWLSNRGSKKRGPVSSSKSFHSNLKRERVDGTADISASDVDRILDKISESGWASLNQREKDILEKASKK